MVTRESSLMPDLIASFLRITLRSGSPLSVAKIDGGVKL